MKKKMYLKKEFNLKQQEIKLMNERNGRYNIGFPTPFDWEMSSLHIIEASNDDETIKTTTRAVSNTIFFSILNFFSY
jgi:hypothetical protein